MKHFITEIIFKSVCSATRGNGRDGNSSMFYPEASPTQYSSLYFDSLLPAPPPQLEKAITYERLSGWTSADMMELCEVQLYLPKFTLQETYDLKSTLSSMGMSDAFNQGKADFSGMSMDRNLFLSNVFHKSFVEINEQGTEASAGTGSEVSFRSRLPSVEFNANHPFLFFIRHNRTNSILFYGRFCSP